MACVLETMEMSQSHGTYFDVVFSQVYIAAMDACLVGDGTADLKVGRSGIAGGHSPCSVMIGHPPVEVSYFEWFLMFRQRWIYTPTCSRTMSLGLPSFSRPSSMLPGMLATSPLPSLFRLWTVPNRQATLF